MMHGRILAWVLPLLLILAHSTSALADSPGRPPPNVSLRSVVPAKAPHGRALVRKQTQTPSTTDGCTTMDFEGLGDLVAIPNFGDVSMPGWLSVVEIGAGGSGYVSGEPSPVTVAFWGDQSAKDILFANPVSKVGLYYASFVSVQLDAFDANGNLVATTSGPRNYDDANKLYNTWFPIVVETAGNKIAKVTMHGDWGYTGIDNLKVCRRPTIHAVELTQSIQELQKIKDLETALGGGGDPAVPIIAGKPGVLRVYFDKLQAATDVKVEIDIQGSVTSKAAVLAPSCTPDQQRRRRNGCASVDFFFTPPAGNWSATVRLRDPGNNEFDSHALPFRSRSPRSIVLRAVTVCDGYNGAAHWQCEDGSVLPGLADLLRRTAPTASVTVDVTSSIVRVDRAVYTGDDWWSEMAKGVNAVYGLWDWAAQQLGSSQRYYFGVVSARAPSETGGMAASATDDGPAHGAGGRASAIRLGVETNKEVVAHEMAHLMGRKHTDTEAPEGATVAPGCYNLAESTPTDWPFADNTIQSASGPEVAFDVAADKPLQPEDTFELMSYCTPRWMSPFTYRHVLTDALGGTAAPAVASRINVVAGTFWSVGGYISGATATIDPIFTRVMEASTDAGSGTYSIVVQDAQGAILFTRHFAPAQPRTETPGPEVQGPAIYLELIPVQAGAARIAVLDPASAEIASRVLGGVASTVAFVAPVGGAILQGQQDVQWVIDDADSASWTSALEYSPDGGVYWIVLGSTTASKLEVDFDNLPGSNGNARLRVFVSDGANTGSAVSASFAVASHLPSVAIIAHDRSHYRLGDVVWLRADAYDRDDGVLDGASVQWTSNRAGALGQGASLPVYSLPPGGHTITVTATDADGNSASASEAITVAGAGPSVVLTTRNSNTAVPRACVEVAVDAFSGSPDVPLNAVRYSMDGGVTFAELDPAHLPFNFVVQGSGFFHIVAHAFDAAGQWDVKDVQFFTAAPCVMTNHPPLADAGPDRTVAAGNLPTLVLLDGSHSSDPDSTPGTHDDIVTFQWFENPFLPSQTFLGSGEQLQVPLAVGVHNLLLQVIDKTSLFGQAAITITVLPGPASSTTTLGTSVNPSVSGQSVTLTATVAGSAPTGTVTFKDGAATLCNAVTLAGGEAPCATSTLAVGSRSLTAIYSGDAGNTGSTSSALPQVVNKAGTSTVLGAHAPNPSAVGAPIAVTATVAVIAPGSGIPTGIITVSDGSANCSITLPATGCDLTPISAGAKTLAAAYSGDIHFNGSASPVVAHIVHASAATLDLDASLTATKYDAFTDGLLVMRYLFGLSGTSLTAGALGATATRTDPSAIKAFLDGMRPALDVDANGTADALTDGLLIVRYLFGLRGDALIDGVVDPLGARNTATAIEDYLQTLMP